MQNLNLEDGISFASSDKSSRASTPPVDDVVPNSKPWQDDHATNYNFMMILEINRKQF